MDAPQTTNTHTDLPADEPIIELTDRIQPLPEDDDPIIELTERVIPAPAESTEWLPTPDIFPLSTPEDALSPPPVDDGYHEPAQAASDVTDFDEQDRLEQDLVFDDDMQNDYDSQDDDFVDSLGMEITSATETISSPMTTPPEPEADALPLKAEADQPAEADGTMDATGLTAEKLEAALQRVVEKIYADKIEGILVETIERVVTREIERIKALLTGGLDGDDER